jgi:predicted TIM-barrel fold metal-dependent hydrolase
MAPKRGRQRDGCRALAAQVTLAPQAILAPQATGGYMRLLDAHTHVFPQYAELAVRTMDAAGVELAISLEWHDGFGETLVDHLRIFGRYPGRFIVFGNVDFSRIGESGFGARAAEQLERDAGAGMAGLKIYKALGLEYRNPDGSFIRVSDHRLDPVWQKAGELGLPVLIHTADPVAFWQPVDDGNFWSGVLYGEYSWWSYYRKGYPSRDELLAERNDVIGRHPDTVFIAPHLGSRADSPQAAADDLDRLPNLYYDFSARIPVMGLPGRHAETTRDLLIRYQDRILFGTDLIFDDTNVPTGMQAQALYQPYELPLNGAEPEAKYVETSAAFLRSHVDFLTTSKIQTEPPFKRTTGAVSIQGVDLPAPVVDRICWQNAARILRMQ